MSFDEYQAVFGAPMSASKRAAIQMLFPAGADLEEAVLIDGLELDDMQAIRLIMLSHLVDFLFVI